MTRGIALALVALLLGAAGEYYAVTVSRVEKDLYRVEDQIPRIYIETRYCYEYAMRDRAVLKWEPYGYDNALIFSNKTTCVVKRLLK